RIIVTDRAVSATPCLCVHLCTVACTRFRARVFFVFLAHRHVQHVPKSSGGVFAAPGTLSCKDREGICRSERGRRAGRNLFFRTISSVPRILSVFCFALTVGFRFLHLWSDFCDEKLPLLSWSISFDKKPSELCQLLVWHGGEDFPAARVFRIRGRMRVRTPLLVEVDDRLPHKRLKVPVTRREGAGNCVSFSS
ncbi:unnamed protein product, partial [Ectocarpus sp. 12 AP-2014]